jgi:hypothetical protein
MKDGTATVAVGGTPVLGRPDPAFLAAADVWSGR